MLHVVILLGVLGLVLFLVRSSRTTMSVLAAIGAHYVAFAGIHSFNNAHNEHASDSHVAAFALMGLWLLLAVLVILFVSLIRPWLIGKHKSETESFVHRVVVDAVAMTVAFAIVNMLVFLLEEHGGLPSMQNIVDRVSAENHFSRDHPAHKGESEVEHTREMATVMLVFGICNGLFAICMVLVHAMAGTRGVVHAFLEFAKATAVMCMAWSLLIWGEWEFEEHYFKGHSHLGLFARVVFAITATVAAVAIVGAMSFIPQAQEQATGLVSVLGMGFGLVVGFAWEEVMDEAIENAAEDQYFGVQVENSVVYAKMAFAIVAALCLLPVYVNRILPQNKLIEEEDSESEFEDDEELASAK
mmetsp:Transcript_46617/g.123125  ORF Transcript_46617/g.123125 Transcript_46617/m.123125 type:complete len:357 (-) Transcript_46617:23-1093(-)